MSPEETIEVRLPLPMDLAATVMQLIGTAYPTAAMKHSAWGMAFVIPADARPRKVSKAKGKPAPVEDGAEEAELLELGPDRIRISSPEALAKAALEVMKVSFGEYPEAINYLEQRCYDPEGHKHYAMTFQRVEGKTPHELRREAEDKLASAETRIAELEGQSGNNSDTSGIGA